MLLFRKILVGGLFVFQNSYAHLLYTQQWSFLGSVMTPSEGTKWFSVIAGLSSLICTGTATMVQSMALKIGLLGLIGGTSLTLALSLFCADQAYAIAEKVRKTLFRPSCDFDFPKILTLLGTVVGLHASIFDGDNRTGLIQPKHCAKNS
jgi:hypothetical protein